MAIHSFTSDKTYETTPESCTCKSFEFGKGKLCKHICLLRHELNRATHFMLLKVRFDVRSQRVIEEKRANYYRYELAIGA